jgi:transposase-like protein
MPQVQLPLFPVGVVFINDALACQCQDSQVVYLNGHLPVFSHAQADLASFRFFTTQLIVNGSATQGEIARAFGVPIVTVKRCVKRHRTRGAAAFFTPAPRREGTRLSGAVLPVAQGLLAEGHSVPQVSRHTGILASTLHKAIRAGRLTGPTKKKSPQITPPLLPAR